MTHKTHKDPGAEPTALNIEDATLKTTVFRDVIWTGKHLQIVLMNIEPGADIGLETHPGNDQFIRLESGKGRVQMGSSKDKLTFDQIVKDGWSVMVPAGTWHDITNIGTEPMKLYTVYGPTDHAINTVHESKADAQVDPSEK